MQRPTALLALAACCCALLAAPAIAGAHAGHDHELEALEQLAPDAVSGACIRTIDVPGQGPSCRDGDLWLVDVPGTQDAPTHGPDTAAALDVPASALDGPAQAALDGASVHDVTCAANARTPRYRLVYAHPSGAYDAAQRDRLRTEVYRASAFMNHDAGPGRTAKLRVACSAGVPSVTVIETTGQQTFESIVASVRTVNPPEHLLERYIVYYDGNVANNPAGQAYVERDTRADVDNASNAKNLSVAATYATTAGVPRWNVILHEVLHTMGAVQSDAPSATEGGHCTSDLDIMCYQDAPSVVMVDRCATLQLDCTGDTYFDASEPTTGYLATHWNVAHWRNRWLDHGAANRDVTPPSKPGTPVVVGTPTTTTVTLNWTASQDDVGVKNYRVEVQSDGSWTPMQTLSGHIAGIEKLRPGASHSFRIVASDDEGNEATSGILTTATLPDEVPPSILGRPFVTGRTYASVSIEWDEATDDVEVASYRIYRRAHVGESPVLATTVPAAARQATVPTSTPGQTVLVSVAAVDSSGNVGERSPELSARSLVDAVAPTVPQVTSAIVSGTTLQLTWQPSIDEGGLAGYVIDTIEGSTRLARAQVGAATVRHDVTDLPRPRDVDVHLSAVDLAGNLSAPMIVHVRFPADSGSNLATDGQSTTVGSIPPVTAGPEPGTGTPTGDGTGTSGQDTPSQRRDTIAPTRPTGLRIAQRTRYGIALAWRPSKDAVGVTRYRVVLAGARGRWITHRTVPARAAARYVVPGLRPGRRYVIAVQALDAAGNVSARSTGVVATIPARRHR